MAITVGDVQKGFSSNGTVTISMTLSAGSLLTAQAEVNNPSVTLSAAWNGSSMTEAIKVTNATTDAYTYIWYHLTPDSGTHNLVITQSGTSAVNAGGIEFIGADTSGIGATASNNQASNTAPTVTITTTAANSVVVNVGTAGGGDSSTTTATVTGTNQTERWQRTSGNSRDTFASTQTTTSAGNYTSSWSLDGSFATTMLALEIKAAATANGNFLSFM